jgi:hypothetical protein
VGNKVSLQCQALEDRTIRPERRKVTVHPGDFDISGLMAPFIHVPGNPMIRAEGCSHIIQGKQLSSHLEGGIS